MGDYRLTDGLGTYPTASSTTVAVLTMVETVEERVGAWEFGACERDGYVVDWKE
jgi:hypothetical protein